MLLQLRDQCVVYIHIILTYMYTYSINYKVYMYILYLIICIPFDGS